MIHNPGGQLLQHLLQRITTSIASRVGKRLADATVKPMSPAAPRQAGRPTASLLTADKITDAATALMVQDGDFTMAKLARKLGVAASSLYNHVASRDQVLAAISDRVARNIDTGALQDAAAQLDGKTFSPSETRTLWIEATEQWARSYRQAFSVAPTVVMALAVTPVRQAPATLAMYEQVIRAFTTFGMTPRQALLTVEALEAFLLGSAIDLYAPTDIYDPGSLAVDHPTMHESYRTLGNSPQEEAFTIGLRALLAGLATTLN
ncbi:TetR/AcrR family transcriptional regulator [Rothia nasisuis]|uniref:TetR/AcrR family transcriptional regulator n=1 Tax=Rothia nasisuis TaxID=2109647 RepID=UPI001F008082|nr:TetR/AcrR family transcriptional regulator C-terminal domain-containing protein [Rothia nasisuis]